MAQRYEYISFLKEIGSFRIEELYVKILEYAVNVPDTYDKKKIKELFEKFFDDGYLGLVKDRLDLCNEYIEKQKSVLNNQKELFDKLNNFGNNLAQITNDIISEVKSEKTSSTNEEELTGKASSLKSFDEKADEIQGRLDKLEEKVDKHEGALNDKLFSLIINTVAILGIFVAVAFAGFGANTLFSQISFDATANIIKNVFYLFLTALFVYNLLFLLFYCIFKIIDRISSEQPFSFWKDCRAFLIIDAIGLGITIVLFFINVFVVK